MSSTFRVSLPLQKHQLTSLNSPSPLPPPTPTPPTHPAQLAPEFAKRNVKLIGLSANDVSSHHAWIKDVEEVASAKYSETVQLTFPIIGDKDRKIATTYDMLDALDKTNVDAKGMPFTVRTVFISEFWLVSFG